MLASAAKNERCVIICRSWRGSGGPGPCRPAGGVACQRPGPGDRSMTSTKIYELPVDITEWKFDGKTEMHFTWEYEDGSAELLDLYEKGKKQQWNASDRLDWSQDLQEDNPMGMSDES